MKNSLLLLSFLLIGFTIAVSCRKKIENTVEYVDYKSQNEHCYNGIWDEGIELAIDCGGLCSATTCSEPQAICADSITPNTIIVSAKNYPSWGNNYIYKDTLACSNFTTTIAPNGYLDRVMYTATTSNGMEINITTRNNNFITLTTPEDDNYTTDTLYYSNYHPHTLSGSINDDFDAILKINGGNYGWGNAYFTGGDLIVNSTPNSGYSYTVCYANETVGSPGNYKEIEIRLNLTHP